MLINQKEMFGLVNEDIQIFKIMKKAIVIISGLLILLFTWNGFSQNRMVTLTVDPSRAIKDVQEFEQGLDIVGTLILDRKSLIEPLIKVEYFPNIKFIKLAIGGNYIISIYKWIDEPLLEFGPGLELGLIIRQRPNLKSWAQRISPAFNFDIRLFLFERTPIIFSYNGQYRTDFSIYNLNAEMVHSVYVGLGYTF